MIRKKELWYALSAQLISESGHGQLLHDETEHLQERYCKLLENSRVDQRFINITAVQNVIRSLAGR